MDEGGIIAIIFVSAMIVLVCQAILASEFKNIAISKGYEDSKYFWYCFLFGIGGMLLVIALPQKIKTYKSEPLKDGESKTIDSNENEPAGKITATVENDGRWTCLMCWKVNSKDSTCCSRCGAKFNPSK